MGEKRESVRLLKDTLDDPDTRDDPDTLNDTLGDRHPTPSSDSWPSSQRCDDVFRRASSQRKRRML